MPGDEQNSINRAENHARSAIILYLTNYDAERDKQDTEVFLLSWRF